MKRIALICSVIGAVFLTGCATDMSRYYAVKEKEIEVRGNAIMALAAAAAQGNQGAIMALALTQGQGGQVAIPQDKTLQWASILVPAATNLYGLRINAGTQRMQIASEETKYGMTLGTLGGIAGQGIDAAGTVVFPPVYAPAGSLQSVD